jgi:hypothetical protein
MNNIIKDNDEDQFANGQISRDLRAYWSGTEPQTRLDAVNVIEQFPDVAREEFSASENWESVEQWRVSQFLPEQIDADERLPGYLREPHLPRFESRSRVMPRGKHGRHFTEPECNLLRTVCKNPMTLKHRSQL